jgi:hypothetical protein
MGQGDPGGQYQSGLDRSGRTEISIFPFYESGKADVRFGSIARITALQHCCLLHPS